MNIQNTLNQPFVPHLTNEEDWEDSTLLKVAACFPFIGIFLSAYIHQSINHKIEALRLPKEHQPYLTKDNALDDNASDSTKQSAIKRYNDLKSLDMDYLKSDIINAGLCLGLTLCALALEIIPIALGIILGICYTLAVASFGLSLYLTNRSLIDADSL